MWELNWFQLTVKLIRRAGNLVTTVHRVITLRHDIRIEQLLTTVHLGCKLILRISSLTEVQVLWFKFRDSITVWSQRILLLRRYVANVVEDTV